MSSRVTYVHTQRSAACLRGHCPPAAIVVLSLVVGVGGGVKASKSLPRCRSHQTALFRANQCSYESVSCPIVAIQTQPLPPSPTHTHTHTQRPSECPFLFYPHKICSLSRRAYFLERFLRKNPDKVQTTTVVRFSARSPLTTAAKFLARRAILASTQSVIRIRKQHIDNGTYEANRPQVHRRQGPAQAGLWLARFLLLLGLVVVVVALYDVLLGS